MKQSRESLPLILAGLIIGAIASALVYFGNPMNMGFCIACFIRDTAGGLGLHRASIVQYIRPEIIGLVLGSFCLSLLKKDYASRGGSAPMTRFVLGFFVMIGCLMFLGCPFRMILRLAGGDLNALLGLAGFVAGILVGVYFLNKGYSLKRSYSQSPSEGLAFPGIQAVFLLLLLAAPAFIFFSEKGPGASHAPLLLSLAAGLIVGGLAQRTRMCMVGGIRDLALFGQWKLLLGFIAIFVSALVLNLILSATTDMNLIKIGFEGQPIAHSDHVWNFLGMLLTGLGCTLLGGCPMRQLILAGEGNSDSAITVLGLLVGAAFAHNFGLAASGKGATPNGKIAVIIGILVVLAIGILNSRQSKKA